MTLFHPRWPALSATRRLLASLFAVLFALPIATLPPPAGAADGAANAAVGVEQAWLRARTAMLPGPQTILLQDQARLELPDGHGFVAADEATALMAALGNDTGSGLIGLILPMGEPAWMMTVDYIAAGHVDDNDARGWQPDALLAALKRGTAAGNARRTVLGLPPLAVSGWLDVPTYDAATQRLSWSAATTADTATDAATINLNTVILGREGYLALNLIANAAQLATARHAAEALVARIRFNAGRRHQDFERGHDRVARYGLSALVDGTAGQMTPPPPSFARWLSLFVVFGALSFTLLAVRTGGRTLRAIRTTPQPAVAKPPAQRKMK